VHFINIKHRFQKTLTVDFLSKTRKKNEGEAPSYWVENSHPAIVSVEVWSMVQAEIARRKSLNTRHSSIHPFSGKIFCAQCGGHFGSKRWHSTSQYSRKVWQCNNKYRNGTRCTTTHIEDEDIQRLFVRAFNQFYTDHTALAEDYETIIAALTNTEKLEKQAADLGGEIEELLELMQKMITENASTAQDQNKYTKKYNGLLARYEAAQAKLDGVNNERMMRSAKREKMRQFFADLAECHATITEFDENLWYAMIESVTVSESTAVFTFKSGATIELDDLKHEN
jgi:hypothetical protein